MTSLDQPELQERLLADDEQVLEDVLRQFGPAFRAVLRRQFGEVLSDGDIEDVLSIGLFRFWKNRHQYDERRGRLRVWFFRIVVNAARDVLKHGWHKARQLEVSADPVVLASLAEAPRNGHPVELKERTISAEQMVVREIVANLPEAQRKIILADAACRDDTASSQRLAKELGIAATSVRVYRKRAMDKIRSELEERGYEIP